MSIIAPISNATVSWANKTPDIASSFTTTHSSGAPSASFLDSVMSLAVDMDKAEHGRKKEASELDPTTLEGQFKQTALNLDSNAYLSAFKKGVSSIETLITKTVISPS